MDRNAIASATEKLELLTIALHESSLVRNKDEDPFSYPRDLKQQTMLGVKSERLTYESGKETIDILRCYVSLGARAVKETSKIKDKVVTDKYKSSGGVEVYFTVEATYRVDYQINKPLNKEEAEEFSNFNAIHNVWAFWRNFVFEIVRSAELPTLAVPLMRGINIKKKLKKITEAKSAREALSK
jgi:hypothetical protein